MKQITQNKQTCKSGVWKVEKKNPGTHDVYAVTKLFNKL